MQTEKWCVRDRCWTRRKTGPLWVNCCVCPQCQALDGAIGGYTWKPSVSRCVAGGDATTGPPIFNCLEYTCSSQQEVQSVTPSLNSGLALNFLWSIECGQNDTVCFLTISLIWPCSIFFFLNYLLDFPGGTVDKSLSANAGDTGSIPDLGRFRMPWSNQARLPQLLSPRAASTETHAPGPCAPQEEKPPPGEACTPQWRVAPALEN